MSVQNEIERINNNVQAALSAVADAGVSVPENANSNDLPAAVLALANEKQDKLTGTQGQVVGFDAEGRPVAQDAPKAEIFSVSLPASGWSNNAQTVSHAMLKAAGYGYIYNPDEASYVAYVSALVRCGDVVTDGQVTFYCDETPTDDITVDFMRIEANENV